MNMKKDQISVKLFHEQINKSWTTDRKLIFASLLATIASLLQAAGGLVPIVGFGISPFTTLPIVIATIMHLRYGLFAYLLTIGLLLLLEPMELFIFPFTTGLLGITLGVTLLLLNNRILQIIINGTCLFIGICIPLYLLNFPVFGPIAADGVNLTVIIPVYVFAILYSLIWIYFSGWFVTKLTKTTRYLR